MSKMIFKPLATPFQADIEFDYEELRKELDEVWKENEQHFIKKYGIKAKTVKGGYSPAAQKMAEKRIGVITLYSQHILNKCLDRIKEEESDIFFAENIDLVKFSKEDNAQVRVKVYLYPKLKFDKELEHEIKDPVEGSVEEFIEGRIAEIRYEHKSLIDSEVVDKNSRVLLDIIESTKNSVRGIWYDFEEVPESIRKELEGKKKGDQFDIEQGDLVTVVKIHDVKEIVLPDFDDELAEISGFESVEKLKEISNNQFDTYKENARLSAVVSHYVEQIMLNSTYGPIPQVFLDRSVESMKKQHIDHFGGDKEKAYQAIGVSSEDEMYNKLVGTTMRDIAQKIALNKYADLHELDREDMLSIQKHMLSSAKWV